MAVTLSKAFLVARPPGEVWDFLTDPANVAGCLPGARLLRRIDERSFVGEVSLRFGLFSLTFRGTATYAVLDRAALEAELEAAAEERHGWGAGRLRMRSRLLEDPAGTRVELEQSFRLEGRLSGAVTSGLLRQAAEYVLGRFARCVRATLDPGRG